MTAFPFVIIEAIQDENVVMEPQNPTVRPVKVYGYSLSNLERVTRNPMRKDPKKFTEMVVACGKISARFTACNSAIRQATPTTDSAEIASILCTQNRHGTCVIFDWEFFGISTDLSSNCSDSDSITLIETKNLVKHRLVEYNTKKF